MSVAIIHAEGVLRKPVGGYFIQEGMRLAQALSHNGQVYVLTDGDKDQTREWLYTESGSKWWDEVETVQESVVDQCRDLRSSRRLAVDIVVCADPGLSASLVSYGFNVLQFTHAEYARPDWRPDFDKTVKPWDSLAKQVSDQARLKAMEAPVRKE